MYHRGLRSGSIVAASVDIADVDVGAAADFGALDLDTTMHPVWLQKLLKDKTLDNKANTQLWTSRLTYILAAVGSAVGLGNIWRFPFLCYRNGGATFLIPYVLSLFLLGIPLLVLEMAIGQSTGKGAVAAFAAFNPRHKGLGWCCFVSGAGIVTYYCVVLGWCLRYLTAALASLGGRLPWAGGRSSEFFQSTVMQKVFLCSTHRAAELGVPALICNASIPMSYQDMRQVCVSERGCACPFRVCASCVCSPTCNSGHRPRRSGCLSPLRVLRGRVQSPRPPPGVLAARIMHPAAAPC